MSEAQIKRRFHFRVRTLLVLMALIGCVAAMRPVVVPSHSSFRIHGGYAYWSARFLWDRENDSIGGTVERRVRSPQGHLDGDEWRIMLSPARTIWPILALVGFLAWKGFSTRQSPHRAKSNSENSGATILSDSLS